VCVFYEKLAAVLTKKHEKMSESSRRIVLAAINADPDMRSMRNAKTAKEFLEAEEKARQRSMMLFWIPVTFTDALLSIAQSSGRGEFFLCENNYYLWTVHRCVLFRKPEALSPTSSTTTSSSCCAEFHDQMEMTTSFEHACHRTIELIAELWEGDTDDAILSHGGALTKSASKR
jgi:hypothetical protein